MQLISLVSFGLSGLAFFSVCYLRQAQYLVRVCLVVTLSLCIALLVRQVLGLTGLVMHQKASEVVLTFDLLCGMTVASRIANWLDRIRPYLEKRKEVDLFQLVKITFILILLTSGLFVLYGPSLSNMIN